jgi:cell division protease FtsH
MLKKLVRKAKDAFRVLYKLFRDDPIEVGGNLLLGGVIVYMLCMGGMDLLDWMRSTPEAEPAHMDTIATTEFLAREKAGDFKSISIAEGLSETGRYSKFFIAVGEGGEKPVEVRIDSETVKKISDQALSSNTRLEFFTLLPPRLGGDKPIEAPRVIRFFTMVATLLGYIMPAMIMWFLVWQVKMMSGVKRRKNDRVETAAKVKFAAVAGCAEAKQELAEAVEFLKNPKKFAAVGARIPRGILLAGPPGNGKTLLARAVAGEADCAFFQASGAEFEDMFVGVGASRVRDIFRKARAHAPCILFIDEIDAVGGKRRQGGSSWETQTINQLLCEMDGFNREEGVVVIAATNLVENLDPALVRAGRFSRHIQVQIPDLEARRELLAIHAKSMPFADPEDAETVARGTAGFSGADLANLVNEAAIRAARAGRTSVIKADFDEARDRIVMGAKTGIKPSTEERKVIAYHEAGHALVALLTPESDPVDRATIAPRGGALGMVVRFPETDRFIVRRSKLLADLRVAMAGRAAEERLLGKEDISTGASGDIRAAVDLARRMISEWGMGSGFAPALAMGAPSPLLPGTGADPEPVRKEIDGLVSTALDEARELLDRNADALERIADGLLAEETLSGDRLRAMVGAAA